MGSRFRKPEVMRLELEEGDWLLVRKYLTAGEERGATARVFKDGTMKPGEKPELDYKHLELSQAIAYLLDWSLTDADDRPIVIRDQPYEFVHTVLGNMEAYSLREILNAIQAHDAAMNAEREHQKKVRSGGSVSDPISTSVG